VSRFEIIGELYTFICTLLDNAASTHTGYVTSNKTKLHASTEKWKDWGTNACDTFGNTIPAFTWTH